MIGFLSGGDQCAHQSAAGFRASLTKRLGFVSIQLSLAAVVGVLCQLVSSAFAQQDPGIRGGMQNTAGHLQYRGIPIPPPAVIRPNPTTGPPLPPTGLALC